MPKPRCNYIPPELRVPGAPGYEQGVVPPIIELSEGSSSSSSTRKKKAKFDPFANLPADGCPYETPTLGAMYKGKPVLFPNGKAA